MTVTDSIADMLTRIRNANRAFHGEVEMPASTLKLDIARILRSEGFIRDYKLVDDKKQGILKVYLKFGPDKERIISGIKRISKPGRRIYVGKREVPSVLGGLGIAILSTPKGVMTDKECKELGTGGEVLCYVW